MPVKLPAQVRPQLNEYAAFYETYVSLVPGTDILGVLEAQRMMMTQLLSARSEREGNSRSAPGIWTVKEVGGHIIDTERIFAYRALRISRNDKTPCEGFEQDDYVKNGNFNERTLVELAEEFAQVRGASLALFLGLSTDASQRRGAANNNTSTLPTLASLTPCYQ